LSIETKKISLLCRLIKRLLIFNLSSSSTGTTEPCYICTPNSDPSCRENIGLTAVAAASAAAAGSTGVLQTDAELGGHESVDNRIHAAVDVRQQDYDELEHTEKKTFLVDIDSSQTARQCHSNPQYGRSEGRGGHITSHHITWRIQKQASKGLCF